MSVSSPDPARPKLTIVMYHYVLSCERDGTATFYGSLLDENQPYRGGMFLERVRGRELYQIGELPVWQEAARWLAR